MQHYLNNQPSNFTKDTTEAAPAAVFSADFTPQFRPSVHTSAQLDKNRPAVKGECCANSAKQAASREVLQKRAKRKFFSDNLAYKIIRELENQESEIVDPEQMAFIQKFKKRAWNTWHCTKAMKQEGQRLTTHYCKNKFCAVCNGIRTAKLIDGYLPSLLNCNDLHFVTLSDVNVKAEELSAEFSRLGKAFTNVKRSLNAYNEKNGFDNIIAIRKLECTYNQSADSYHPHLHIIVQGKRNAYQIKSRWLKMNPTAQETGQDIQKIDSSTPDKLEDSLKELFKYVTKFTKLNEEGKEVLYPMGPLLNILHAFDNKRSLIAYGVKMISEEIEEEDLKGQNYEFLDPEIIGQKWTYETNRADWVQLATGELLTNNTPDRKTVDLFYNPSRNRNDDNPNEITYNKYYESILRKFGVENPERPKPEEEPLPELQQLETGLKFKIDPPEESERAINYKDRFKSIYKKEKIQL